jgi:WhiB family redox-sensing transcriptional regulator
MNADDPDAEYIFDRHYAMFAEDDPSWRTFAHCVDVDPEIFFPERGGSLQLAKSFCADCPVTEPCLDFGLRHPRVMGVWGGTSQRERQAILALRKNGEQGVEDL